MKYFIESREIYINRSRTIARKTFFCLLKKKKLRRLYLCTGGKKRHDSFSNFKYEINRFFSQRDFNGVPAARCSHTACHSESIQFDRVFFFCIFFASPPRGLIFTGTKDFFACDIYILYK